MKAQHIALFLWWSIEIGVSIFFWHFFHIPTAYILWSLLVSFVYGMGNAAIKASVR